MLDIVGGGQLPHLPKEEIYHIRRFRYNLRSVDVQLISHSYGDVIYINATINFDAIHFRRVAISS